MFTKTKESLDNLLPYFKDYKIDKDRVPEAELYYIKDANLERAKKILHSVKRHNPFRLKNDIADGAMMDIMINFGGILVTNTYCDACFCCHTMDKPETAAVDLICRSNGRMFTVVSEINVCKNEKCRFSYLNFDQLEKLIDRIEELN